MNPTERAQLAAIEHYDRQAAAQLAALRAEPWKIGRRSLADPGRALDLLARARRAELLDPDPLPHIERGA
jgi:hypothetical protein